MFQAQQQRGRRIPVPLPGMLGASTFPIKAGFDFRLKVLGRSFTLPCVAAGLGQFQMCCVPVLAGMELQEELWEVETFKC